MKPKSSGKRSSLRKAARFFVTRIPFPARKGTARNPVRVVFVCDFGRGSKVFSVGFFEFLRKKGINGVKSGFCGLNAIESKKYEWKKFSKTLAKADVVIHMYGKLDISRIKKHSITLLL